MHAVVADFEQYLGLEQPPAARRRRRTGRPRLLAFLGCTIGNMVPAERAAFLRRVRAQPPAGRLVPARHRPGQGRRRCWCAAYDDAAGVTAAFNKNVLAVLNRELGADFDLDAFEHVAVWDPANEWIEMRLRVDRASSGRGSRDLDLDVDFAAGEEMRTEVSAKFRRAGVEAELAAAGLAMRAWWTDPADQFGLSLSVPVYPGLP